MSSSAPHSSGEPVLRSSEAETPGRISYLAVGLAAILVYLNSLPNGFAYDDLLIIVGNPAVQHLGNLARTWLTPYWPVPDGTALGLYRPLTVFFLSIQWNLGGGSPVLFHLVSLILHAGCSLLVYRVLRTLAGSGPALAGGLIFAVHPVHVEAVANTVGQAELLSSLFSLTAVVVYAERRGHEPISGVRFLFLPVLYFLGMLAKENAIVLPAILLAMDLAHRRQKDPGYRSQALAIGIALLAVAGVYLALRWIVLGGGITGSASVDIRALQDMGSRLLTALSVWPEYVRLLLFPLDLSAMYDPATVPHLDSVTGQVVLGGSLLLFVLGTATLIGTRPAWGLGSAWFLVSILPVSNLIVPVGTLLAERTLYLPSVALSIWVAYLARRILARPGPSWWVNPGFTLGVGLVVVLFGVRSAIRNPVWEDNDILFSTTVRDHPENFRAQWFQAMSLVQKGDSLESMPHWERALATYDGSSVFLTSYARFLYHRGELERADDLVGKALRIHPAASGTLFLRGLVAVRKNRIREAREQVRTLDDLGFSAMARSLEDSLRIGTSHPGSARDIP